MKSPSIATYKIIKQGERGVYQIIREDGTDIVVHYLNLESMDIYMLIERQYPLSAEVCKAMLDKKLQGGKPDEDCYKLLKWMEKQAGIRKHKDWLVQEQTDLGKDFSNPLMADNLPKFLWIKDELAPELYVQIPSPPLPVSSPLPISPPPLLDSPTHPLGYRAAMIQLRAESPFTSYPLPLPPHIVLPRTRASMAMMRAIAPSTYCLVPRSKTPPLGTPPILLIPLPTSSPPLLLPSIDCRAYFLEVTLPPWKRLCIAPGLSTMDAEIRRNLKSEIGYKITDIWEDLDEIVEEILATDVAELGQRMTDFVTTIRQDTYEIYGRLDDAQDDRSLMSGQLNLLRRDRRSHACTARLMKSEARASHEIGDLWAVDSRRQAQLAEALTLLRTLQTQMVELQSQQRLVRDPAHPDVPKEAGKNGTKKSHKINTVTITTTTTPMTDEQLKTLIAQGVADVLAERDATRSRNGEDSHDLGTRVRRQAPLARKCNYSDFMKCKPLYFKGTEGVVELTYALTWWNSHVRTVGHDVAYAMTWTNLKKKMTDKYCPMGEIKKLKVELWNMKV
ncbi:hypothetical protein Tco_0644080 [Tanacetum coccineum]